MTDKIAFDILGRRLINTSFLLPVFLVTTALFICSIFLMTEDYFTTLWGYEMLSTRPGFWFTAWVVAALPQLIQILSAYFAIGFGLDGNVATRKYALMSWAVFLAMFLVDVYTDTIYRVITPDNPVSWIEGLAQSVIIFTLGSEISFAVTFGFLKVIGWKGLEETGTLLRSIIVVIGKVLATTIEFLQSIGKWVGEILLPSSETETRPNSNSQSGRGSQTPQQRREEPSIRRRSD